MQHAGDGQMHSWQPLGGLASLQEQRTLTGTAVEAVLELLTAEKSFERLKAAVETQAVVDLGHHTQQNRIFLLPV